MTIGGATLRDYDEAACKEYLRSWLGEAAKRAHASGDPNKAAFQRIADRTLLEDIQVDAQAGSVELRVRLRAGGGHDGAAFGVVLSGYIKQQLGDKSLRLAEALLPRLAERGAAAGEGSGGKKLHRSAHADPPHACMVTAAIARQSRHAPRASQLPRAASLTHAYAEG